MYKELVLLLIHTLFSLYQRQNCHCPCAHYENGGGGGGFYFFFSPPWPQGEVGGWFLWNTGNYLRKYLLSRSRKLWVLIFITTENINLVWFYFNRNLNVRVMAHAVGRRRPNPEARIQFQASHCGTYFGRSSTGTGVSSSASVSRCQPHSIGAAF
jgi:hypothetical protein